MLKTVTWELDNLLSIINKANPFLWASDRIENRNLQEEKTGTE